MIYFYNSTRKSDKLIHPITVCTSSEQRAFGLAKYKNMKKLLLLLLVSLMSITTNAQSNVEFKGNTIVTKSTRAKGEAKKTTFTWQDRKGKEYPVYMSSTGSCFIVRSSSNTGKEYKSYLGPEVSQQICTKLGVEYKGKKKEKNKS